MKLRAGSLYPDMRRRISPHEQERSRRQSSINQQCQRHTRASTPMRCPKRHYPKLDTSLVPYLGRCLDFRGIFRLDLSGERVCAARRSGAPKRPSYLARLTRPFPATAKAFLCSMTIFIFVSRNPVNIFFRINISCVNG